MTTTDSGGPSETSAPIKPARPTAFERELRIEGRYAKLQQVLTRVARQHVPERDVPDMVSGTFVRAVKRDLEGRLWDPERDDLARKLADILFGVLKDWRRRITRKPTGALDEASQERLEQQPVVDEVARAAQARAQSLSERIVAQLPAGEIADVARAMFECGRDGIDSKAEIAARLAVDIQLVYRAQKLITKYGKELRAKRAEESS